MNNVLDKFKIQKNSNILDVEVKNYGECGFCKEQKEVLNVSWEIYSQWLFISQTMGDKEWGGVLSIKNGTILGFKLPEQIVGKTECEFKEELGGEGIIHSHHNMGAFHSTQDDNHARNLYEYSIVISNQGSIATKRKKLPCGGYGYIEIEIKVDNLPNLDLSKIKEPVIQSYEYEFPYASGISKDDHKTICHKCFRENKSLTVFNLNGKLAYLCKECEEEYDMANDETEICDNCMKDFSVSMLNEYGGGLICNNCITTLEDNY